MTIATPQLKSVVKPESQATLQAQSQPIQGSDASVMLFSGLTWRDFQSVEKLLDRSGYRFSFLDGVLEIARMPKELHETTKERLGALLELYLGAGIK
jgi:Uma2 family endonuclease